MARKRTNATIVIVGILIVLILFGYGKKQATIPGYYCVYDSDGGYDPFTFGAVSYHTGDGDTHTYQDICQSDGMLREYLCGPIYLEYEIIYCSDLGNYECNGGECVPAQGSTCSNPYGANGNYYCDQGNIFQCINTNWYGPQEICPNGGVCRWGDGVVRETPGWEDLCIVETCSVSTPQLCNHIGPYCINTQHLCVDAYEYPENGDIFIGCEGSDIIDCVAMGEEGCYNGACYTGTVTCSSLGGQIENLPCYLLNNMVPVNGATDVDNINTFCCEQSPLSLLTSTIGADINLGESKTITATFASDLNLQDVVVEAQLVPPSGIQSVVTIDIDECAVLAGTDQNKHFRNKLVDFSIGTPVNVNFIFSDLTETGTYLVYVDALTECGIEPDLVMNEPIGSFEVIGPDTDCVPDWQCGAWSNVTAECGTKQCTDANECGMGTDGSNTKTITKECKKESNVFLYIGLVFVMLIFIKVMGRKKR